MAGSDFSRLKRPVHRMPVFVRQALTARKLLRAYRARPAYQQNDYLSWIQRAKLPATRQKRLAIMLEDLKLGDRYMGMAYRSKKPRG